jgi:hypothetical protein
MAIFYKQIQNPKESFKHESERKTSKMYKEIG